MVSAAKNEVKRANPFDCFKPKEVLIVGLSNSGQQEIINAFLKDDVICSDYYRVKERLFATIRKIEIPTNEIDEQIKLVVDTKIIADNSKNRFFIICCFDSQKDLASQLHLFESLIILNNEIRKEVQYIFVMDILHNTELNPKKYSNKFELFIPALNEKVKLLQRANYLPSKLFMCFDNLLLASLAFGQIKNLVLTFIQQTLRLQQPKINGIQIHDNLVAKTTNKKNQQAEFAKFIQDYKIVYANAGLFKRSKFLQEFKAYHINNMMDVKDFVKRNPQSRTALLYKRQQEHSADLKFARFLNEHEQLYLKPGLFKKSSFRNEYLVDKIKTMQDVYDYAAANPSTRTAYLLKSFR